VESRGLTQELRESNSASRPTARQQADTIEAFTALGIKVNIGVFNFDGRG
jgi:hypothetical protein